MQQGHAAGTCGMNMQQGHAGLHFKDMQQGHKIKRAFDAALTSACRTDIQQENAARTCSIETQHGHAVCTRYMDMQHGEAAWMQSMLQARDHVHAAWNAACPRCKSMLFRNTKNNVFH